MNTEQPEQGYRSCVGILRLEKRYGHRRLEAACARALCAGERSYRHVDSLLKQGLDRQRVKHHENIRGGRYYH